MNNVKQSWLKHKNVYKTSFRANETILKNIFEHFPLTLKTIQMVVIHLWKTRRKYSPGLNLKKHNHLLNGRILFLINQKLICFQFLQCKSDSRIGSHAETRVHLF